MKFFLVATVLLSGLMAGLFYAYSCSVNPGLKMLTDREYIRAMQAINQAILNPLFFLAFLGLIVVFSVTCFQLYGSQKIAFYWMIAAMLIYVIGVFGTTMFFNVPLNDQLANFSVSTTKPEEISAMRQHFEAPWNAFHSFRTVASVVSFCLTILSLLNYKS